MSTFVISIIIASSAFLMALRHLNQSIGSYYDLVALFMVIGGTLAVGAILIPWELRHDLKSSLKNLIKNDRVDFRSVLFDCLNSIRSNTVIISNKNKDTLYAQILKDGFELLQLGISTERITEILFERKNQYGKRKRKVANALKSLAKYPPAFGLVGTVLGLVNVMKGVSNGLGGKETALEMSVALVATMYGLIMANLIVNPSGELLSKNANDEEGFGEIAINTIQLLSERASLLESQEILNSYAPYEQRVNLLFEQDQAS